jgi:hypothetical protein
MRLDDRPVVLLFELQLQLRRQLRLILLVLLIHERRLLLLLLLLLLMMQKRCLVVDHVRGSGRYRSLRDTEVGVRPQLGGGPVLPELSRQVDVVAVLPLITVILRANIN